MCQNVSRLWIWHQTNKSIFTTVNVGLWVKCHTTLTEKMWENGRKGCLRLGLCHVPTYAQQPKTKSTCKSMSFLCQLQYPPFTDYIRTSQAVCSMRGDNVRVKMARHTSETCFGTAANSATWHRVCTLLKSIPVDMTKGEADCYCCYSIMTYHSIHCIAFFSPSTQDKATIGDKSEKSSLNLLVRFFYTANLIL